MQVKPIAIVLLNYNSWADTIECLESVLKLDYKNFKIYLIDNSNDDSSWDNIILWAKGDLLVKESKYPELVFPLVKKPINYNSFEEEDAIEVDEFELILIKAKKNNGFASGNNIALKDIVKRGIFEYVWVLNNDTVVPKNSLQVLVSYVTNNESKVGIAGSVLAYYSTPKILQGIGGKYNKWFGTSKPIKNGDNISSLNNNYKIDYPIGAAMFVSNQFIKDVGLMNEEYFLYYEELDWVVRGKKLGFNIGYCKDSLVYHKVGASIGTGKALVRSEFSDYYTLKNRLKFVKKYYPWYLPTTYLGFLIVIFNRLRRNQINYAKNAIKIMLNLDIEKFRTDK